MWFYRTVIFGIILLTWTPILASRFASGVSELLIGQSIIISVTGCISIAIFYYMDKKIVKSERNLTIFYFATSTPLSIFLFVYSFNEVFGRFLNYPN